MNRKNSIVSHPIDSMRERVYAYLQRRIASGELEPETPVSELALTKELNLGRTPVRKTLAR
ncbi:MAG: GntR family transcriptional regulator [Acidobacteriaceae bacterium]